MKLSFLLYLCLLLAILVEVQGCHPLKKCKRGKKPGGGHDNNCIEDDDDDDDDKGDVGPIRGPGGIDGPPRGPRRKRQIPIDPFTEFFVNCLGRYQYSTQYDLPTIVDFTLRKTNWYGKTSEQYCVGDAVDCWRYLINSYLSENSQFLEPTKTCIGEYGTSTGRLASPPDTGSGVNNPGRNQGAIPASIPQFSFRLKSRYQPRDPEDRSVDQVESLVKFVSDEVGCALDFCNCENVRVPRGEYCGQNWYTRIAAMTSPSSGLRQKIVNTANEVIDEALGIAPTGGPATTLFTLPPFTINPPIQPTFFPPLPPQPPLRCFPLQNPGVGTLSCTFGFQVNSQCDISCPFGYSRSGQATVCRCFLRGCQWSGPAPSCQQSRIPNLLLSLVAYNLITTTEAPKIDCTDQANKNKPECIDCTDLANVDRPECIDCTDPNNSKNAACIDCSDEANADDPNCATNGMIDCNNPKYSNEPSCRGIVDCTDPNNFSNPACNRAES